MIQLVLEPLAADAFKAFGEVIGHSEVVPLVINQGFARRFDDLARIDVSDQGGVPKISIFEARAAGRPLRLRVMERHPLGSQIFFPLQNRPWIVVTCLEPADASSYRAFHATGQQGVNYRRNAWHHPLVALCDGDRFLVVDRQGPQANLEEIDVSRSGLMVDFA